MGDKDVRFPGGCNSLIYGFRDEDNSIDYPPEEDDSLYRSVSPVELFKSRPGTNSSKREYIEPILRA